MSDLTIAFLAGIVGMIGYGLADYYSFCAINKKQLTEMQASFWLFLFSSIIVWGAVIIFDTERVSLSLETVLLLVLFALMNVAPYLLFFIALSHGQLSVISSVFAIYPLATMAFSVLFFGEKLIIYQIAAIFIGCAAVIALSIVDIGAFRVVRGFHQVVLAAIIIGAFFPMWDSLISKGAEIYLAAILDSMIALILGLLVITKERFQLNGIGYIFRGSILNSVAIMGVSLGLANSNLTSIVVMLSSAVPVISFTLGVFLLQEKPNLLNYVGLGLFLIALGCLFI
jgi:drug/metabolite transporter (DMT)-like permease